MLTRLKFRSTSKRISRQTRIIRQDIVGFFLRTTRNLYPSIKAYGERMRCEGELYAYNISEQRRFQNEAWRRNHSPANARWKYVFGCFMIKSRLNHGYSRRFILRFQFRFLMSKQRTFNRFTVHQPVRHSNR